MKRREFIKTSTIAATTACISGIPAFSAGGVDPVAKVTGESPYEIAKKGVDLLMTKGVRDLLRVFLRSVRSVRITSRGVL